MPSAHAIAYVKARFSKANPVLAGREISAEEAKDFFDELARAYDAGAGHPKTARHAITVSDRLGTSHFHPDGRIEHEMRK